jgi:hypothetical protein
MSSREKILARRAKFIAAAVASAGAIACSSESSTTPGPQVCLEPAIDASADTRPMPCLDPVVDTGVSDSADTAPMPCLTPLNDTGVEDTGAEDTDPDAAPTPCLKMPIPDGG